VRMPGVSGFELQQTLTSAVHEIPIMFITGHGDIPMSVKAMKAGAVDFLTKPFSAKELLDAIQRAVAKDTRGLSTEAREDEIRARVKLLTPRESQVFALVVTGMLNKQIASELGIGEKTVKVHRARVMEKMQAGSVAALVRLADAVGIIVTKA
jgi:FixJ family two-component response regulator